MFDPEYTISLYFNGDETLSQADLDQLSEWIEQSQENASKFIQASFMHRAVHDSLVGADINKSMLLDLKEATNSSYEVVMDSNVSLKGIDVTKDVLSDKKEETVAGFQVSQNKNILQAMQELADFEATAPTVYIEKPIEEPEKPVGPPVIKPARGERKVSKFSVFALILSTAAMLLFTAIVFFTPVYPIVATLTDSINAEWINTKDVPVNWDLLSQGEMTLARGFAEITFDDGAVVVVEGPAIIKLESPKSMFLTSGKISAVVSEYATGFTVNTLSASIVDLGTEFGVSVEDDGSCNLSMFKGLANLVVGQKGQKRTTQRVSANEARSVDLAGVVKDVSLDEKGFVRRIDSEEGFVWRGEKSLSLADIVGGGDGYGNQSNLLSIDPLTGKTTKDGLYGVRYGNNKYAVTDFSRYIDGVFIPDGGKGDVLISSADHVFKDCPDTDGDTTYSICNYGPMTSVDNKEYRMIHNGVEYGIKDKRAIVMHSNAGITFDLGEIRRSIPSGTAITDFIATCAFSEDVKVKWPRAKFWVIVDGQIRFAKEKLADSQGERVQVGLSDSERFLTLAVTDGGNVPEDKMISHSYDISFWADPVLVLENP